MAKIEEINILFYYEEAFTVARRSTKFFCRKFSNILRH